MLTEEELLDWLKSETTQGNGRVRRGYSETSARVVVQQVLAQQSATGSLIGDPAVTSQTIARKALDRLSREKRQQDKAVREGQAVQGFFLTLVGWWLVQAYVMWAARRLLDRLTAEREVSP